MMIKQGDYVVYLKGGDRKELGYSKKHIWIVESVNRELIASLKNTLDNFSGFSTPVTNLITVSDLIAENRFVSKYFNDQAFNLMHKRLTNNTIFKNNTTVGDTKMAATKNMVSRTTDANVSAVKVAAVIATGRTVNEVIVSKFKNKLPIMVRGYAETPVGAIVIANLVDFGVKQFAADNAKFNYVSNAMMQAAMVDLLAEFDFAAIMNDILANVVISEEA